MLRVSYVFAFVLAATAVAHAEDPRDKALKLFDQSNKAYKSGKFEEAADLLRKAYDTYPEPLLLYNLGRAQEGVGDPKGAIESYERYLREAKQVDDRAAIQRRIDTLRAQIEKQEEDARRRAEDEQRMREQQEHLRQERDRLEQERREREAADSRTAAEKYGPYAVAGTGGALLVTGLFLGLHADSKHDDAVAAPVQLDAAQLQTSAEHWATAANVMFVLGGLAVAGGAAWKAWQWQHPSGQTSAQVQVTPGSVAFEWVFP